MQRQLNEALKGSQGMPLGMFGPMPTASSDTAVINADDQATALIEQKIAEEQSKLEQMSITDLKAVATKLSISGAESMSKTELINNILRVSKIEESVSANNTIEIKRKAELNSMSIDELKIIAKKLSISGANNMTKEELVGHIIRTSSNETTASQKLPKQKETKEKESTDKDLDKK